MKNNIPDYDPRESMNIDELDWEETEKKFAQMDKETARRIANGGTCAPTRPDYIEEQE